MIRLLGLVISIGIADSLNPTTIAPCLYLASGRHARRQVAEFTLAVFLVYMVGGLIIALGPGRLVRSLIPHPGRHLGYLLEAIAGATMLTASVFLWSYRRRLATVDAPQLKREGRSGAIMGATITAVELPTAFPYFAAIAAIVGTGVDVDRVVFLLGVFNLCFIAPLLGILGTLIFAGHDAQRRLTRGREWLEARWPVVLAVLFLLAGVIVMFLGLTGLLSSRHGVGRVFRRLRRALHLHP